MSQKHSPGCSLALPAPTQGPLAKPSRAEQSRARFPVPGGEAPETAIALAGLDEPPMPIYCARQPLWSRHTSGWSQLQSARGQRRPASPPTRQPAEWGGESSGGGRRPGRLHPPPTPSPPPVPGPAGFPDVNRAALQEHSHYAQCVI